MNKKKEIISTENGFSIVSADDEVIYSYDKDSYFDIAEANDNLKDIYDEFVKHVHSLLYF